MHGNPYHQRITIGTNFMYIALILFIDILIRDCTNHDDEAKHAYSYLPSGHLLQFIDYLDQCIITFNSYLPSGHQLQFIDNLDQCIITFTILLSDRRALDLNMREYYLEMLKEAKLIKPHNPESDTKNPENIFKTVVNASF